LGLGFLVFTRITWPSNFFLVSVTLPLRRPENLWFGRKLPGVGGTVPRKFPTNFPPSKKIPPWGWFSFPFISQIFLNKVPKQRNPSPFLKLGKFFSLPIPVFKRKDPRGDSKYPFPGNLGCFGSLLRGSWNPVPWMEWLFFRKGDFLRIKFF